MASLVAVFCVFAVILHMGVYCKIISMKVATAGYTKGAREKSNNFNLEFTMDQYYKGKNCVKVMLIEQTQPKRKLEEITVSCTFENWSAMNYMVNYGNTLHIQTKGRKAEWGVFDLGSSCIQHIYKDNGVYLLGKEEDTINRKDCDKVIRTSRPYKKAGGEENPGIEEENDSAVIEMNGNMAGCRFTGTTNNNNNGIVRTVIQDYVTSYNECVRLVILSIYGMEAQRVKIHCTANSRSVNGHYQYGSAFTFRPEPGNNVFKGLFNLGYGACIRKTYTAVRGFFSKIVVSPDEPTSDDECQDLGNVRDLLGISGKTSWSQSGITYSGNNGVGTSFVNNFNNGPSTTATGKHKAFGSTSINPPTQVNDGVYVGDGIGSLFIKNSGNSMNFQNNVFNNHGSFITSGTGTDEHDDDDDEYDWDEDDDEDEGEWEEDGDDEDWGDEEDDGEWEDGDDLGEWEDEEGDGGLEEIDHIYVEPVKTTKKPAKQPTVPAKQPTVIAPSTEERQLINKQKVAVLNSNVAGYQKQGNAKTIEGSSYLFTVQKYVKPGTDECFKMVTVRKDGEEKDNAKISCEYEEPDRKRGLNLHFEGVIYESLPFKVIYVVKDGFCLSKNYFKYAPIKQEVLSEYECQELTGRSKTERVSGVIPGTEPISVKDFAVMEKQIVAVLKGSVKNFTPQKQSTYTTASYTIEVQDYVKGSQCVKVVSLKRGDHDQYFERVKVPCKVTAPVITDDEDIELNFGNVIYIQNRVSVVYVIEDGVCLERTYYVVMEQVKYNERTLSLTECYGLTRWKREQRSSSEKLNQQPPPKTKEAPGLMWMLSLNANMESGFTAANVGSGNFNGGGISLQFQDFGKEERCVRKATLKFKNAEVDRFLVSCGPYKSVNMMGDQVLYGKAFLIVPGTSANTYIARFNLRERSCVKKTYTVKGKILISKPVRVNDKECKELMQGTVQLNMNWTNKGGTMFSMSNFGNTYNGGGGGTYTDSNGNTYNGGNVIMDGNGNTYQGGSGSGSTYMDSNGNVFNNGNGNSVIMGNGMTISNVGPGDHIIM